MCARIRGVGMRMSIKYHVIELAKSKMTLGKRARITVNMKSMMSRPVVSSFISHFPDNRPGVMCARKHGTWVANTCSASSTSSNICVNILHVGLALALTPNLDRESH